MLLHVIHETAYDYAPKVKTAQHMAHLKPTHDAQQQVLSHSLRIDPAPAQQTEMVDVYGNTRAFFSLSSPHDALKVVADSTVSTAAPALPDSDIAWDQVRERMRYHRSAAWDPAAGFLFASPHVPRHDNFLAYARPSFPAGRPLVEAARELMERIHGDFEYESEATDVSTPALEALEMRKGVCQDFAHIMLACLRSLGLPARYVSGYMLTQPPSGQPRLGGSDASHAWVSLYVPGDDAASGMWAGLDPTNNRAPAEEYVTLATGRDYSDVSPLRGVIHGGANHTLRVAVTVTPVNAAAR
jgi:transglutaminase-like putative cysteine protease